MWGAKNGSETEKLSLSNAQTQWFVKARRQMPLPERRGHKKAGQAWCPARFPVGKGD
ncbi:hypothetical protein GCM10027594_12590 [Hymenobacter agri]